MTDPPNDAKPEVVADETQADSQVPPASNRRGADRHDVSWQVDCETEGTFLYAYIRNISELGIFVQTDHPLEIGTHLRLAFGAPGGVNSFSLIGEVQWINPVRPLSDNRNPGMGILFVDITLEDRERLVEAVRTIAYVRQDSN